MIDMANYRTPIEQYNVLKEEVQKFSEELSGRNFAIALTKIDAYYGEDLEADINKFIEEVGLEPSNSNEFGLETSNPYYVQDTTFERFDREKPAFILPISSVTHLNTNPIKFALYNLIGQ